MTKQRDGFKNLFKDIKLGFVDLSFNCYTILFLAKYTILFGLMQMTRDFQHGMHGHLEGRVYIRFTFVSLLHPIPVLCFDSSISIF